MAEPTAAQREAARAEVRRVLDRIAGLEDRAAEESLRRLEALRADVVRELAGATGFRAAQLQRLRQGIDRLATEYGRRFGLDLGDLSRQSWDLGEDLVEAPLRSLGLHVGTVRALPASVFEAATVYNLVLVRGLSQDTSRAVQREVLLGATGAKTPQEVMDAIGESLESPGVFRSIAVRAEAIARTEIGRISAMAGQARKEEAAKIVPGLKKQWVHGPVRRQSRQNHYLQHPGGVNGQIREVDEEFEIPGGAKAGAETGMFPRDPVLSAANSVNCRCQSVPYREDWALAADELRKRPRGAQVVF